tara:strand:+ start:1327 stop:2682 length:1356 start_codon:yes stop_codon:yes gene_type:complete
VKILNRYIFKELLYPFFLSLFVLIFVLLTQFLAKHLDRFLGKDLSLLTILKFLIFNSASIISLAAPMAVLVATMMTFGRLSSDNEITGFKASGISYLNFLKPGLLFGVLIVILMIPFNLWLLPEMNHNIRKLSYTISKNRPDIEIKENMLNSIYDRMIFVGDKIEKKSFKDIIIFDKNNTVLANNGNFKSLKDGIILNLYNGSIHEDTQSDKNEYRKTYFNEYKILIPYDKINFDKDKTLVRQDREMNYETLLSTIDNKNNEIINLNKNNEISTQKIKLLNEEKNIIKPKIDSLKNMSNNKDYKQNYIRLNKIETSINNLKNNVKKNNRIIPILKKDINRYYVELHKKIAIPIACFIFILLGIPLGIISKKGNFSISIAVSLGFFILYWALLTVGEFLGDEGKLNPALAIWLGNISIGLLSIYLFYASITENNIINSGIIAIKNTFNKIKK